LDTVVFRDTTAIEYFTNEVVLVKLHGKQDTVEADRYGIKGYPTCVLVDIEGNEVDRIVGYRPPEEFLQTIADYKQGIGTLDDLLARAETSTDRELFYEIGDKYKYRAKSADARVWFDKVVQAGQPGDSMSGAARFAIADMHRRNDRDDLALADFQSMKQDFAGSYLEEWSSIYIAIAHRDLGDTTASIAAFEQFAVDFPESEDAEWATGQAEKLSNPEVDTE